MAEQRLLEAAAAVDKALANQSSSVFQDLAGDATTALRKAVLACKANPKALDGVVKEQDMAGALRVVLKRGEKKVTRPPVVECLRGLLARPVWVRAAARDADLKAKLLEFLREQAGAEDLQKFLEDGAGDGGENDEKITFGESEVEITRRHLHEGYLGLKNVGFLYPTDGQSGALTDVAIKGFGQFYKGVSRLDCKVAIAAREDSTSRGLDKKQLQLQKARAAMAQKYREVLELYEADWAKILQFLASLHKAKATHRGQAAYVADKLAQLSDSFRAVRDQRNDWPWLPNSPPPPEVPLAPRAPPKGARTGLAASKQEEEDEEMPAWLRAVRRPLGEARTGLAASEEEDMPAWLRAVHRPLATSLVR